MFGKWFLILCSVPFIWCELTRNDIKISSRSLAGGIVPSESISLSTSTGTELSPAKQELQTQNITLKTPFLTVSVKNATATSAETVAAKITDMLADVVDTSNRDLLLQPEALVKPEDIMLDLNIPMRVKELEDLAKASSIEQFKRKVLHSSLLDKLYASALGNVPSNFLAKRRKRGISQEFHTNPAFNIRSNDKQLVVQRQNPVNRKNIFYHHPKKSYEYYSDFVYEPETNRAKIRRNADSAGEFLDAAMPSDMVGAARIPHPVLHLPHLIPPPPIRAPILPHRPIHHIPRAPLPPPLPVIPPAVLAQLIRARARHPLPPLLPIGLLPQIARTVGILPSQLFPPMAPYTTEELIILRSNPRLQHNVRSMLPSYLTPSQYPVMQPARQVYYDYPTTQNARLVQFHPPVEQHPITVGNIFGHLPPYRQNSRNPPRTPYVPQGYFDRSPFQPRVIHLAHPNRPAANNPVNRQFLMPVAAPRFPRKVQTNNLDSQEVLESFEQTGTLLGNTLFSFLNHMPTITR